MATPKHVFLTGCPNGATLTLTSVSGGVTIHAATSTPNEMDKTVVYVSNSLTTSILLTLYSGTTAFDYVTIPGRGSYTGQTPQVWIGGGGKILKGGGSTTGALRLVGYANRMASE